MYLNLQIIKYLELNNIKKMIDDPNKSKDSSSPLAKTHHQDIFTYKDYSDERKKERSALLNLNEILSHDENEIM